MRKMRFSQKKAGVILSYLSEVIKILSGLLYTPIMLRLLGQSEYGLYQLVYSVVSYLSLLSLGFASSYMRFYSRKRAKEEHEEIARLNGMFMVIFCSVSLICIFCGFIMINNVKMIFGTGLTDGETGKAKILLAIMVFNLALTFPSSVFNCYISAHEQFFFQKILLVLQNILNPFLTLPLLLMGYGSVGMVCITTFLTIVRFMANSWFCFSKMKMRFLFKGFKLSLLGEMWVFTFFIFLNQIIDQVNWSVDKFLLGRYVGTTAVAIYGVGGQINTMYLQFATSISNVFIPRVNRIVAESDNNYILSELFTRIGRIQFIILALILSGFFFFGRPFLRFWAGSGYDEAYYVTLFLIAPVTVPLIQNIGMEIQRAKNKHKTRSVVYFFVAIGNVFLSIPLIKFYGPRGAAAGTAIALVVGNIFFMNWYYNKYIGLDMAFFWRSIFRFIPALIVPIICGIMMMKILVFSNLVTLVLGIWIYISIYCMSMWLIGMNTDEKSLILDPIKNIIKR